MLIQPAVLEGLEGDLLLLVLNSVLVLHREDELLVFLSDLQVVVVAEVLGVLFAVFDQVLAKVVAEDAVEAHLVVLVGPVLTLKGAQVTVSEHFAPGAVRSAFLVGWND